MKIVLYLHMHQPWRLARFRYLDLGSGRSYFDVDRNLSIFRGIADRCYLPALDRLARAARERSDFRVSLSITGTFLEQARIAAPEVFDRVRELYRTGQVALVAETYYHSLAFLLPPPELHEEVEMHRAMLHSEFGANPKVLRMTELAYSDDLARFAERERFHGMLAEGWEGALKGEPATMRYCAAPAPTVMLLLRHYPLSDDVWVPVLLDGMVRVSAYRGEVRRLDRVHAGRTGRPVHGLRDVRGAPLRADGHLGFPERAPGEGRRHPHLGWATVDEAIQGAPRGPLSVPYTMSWADQNRDLGAWLGNDLQRSAFEAAKKVGVVARQANDPAILTDWRKLLTSDHFYYMYVGGHGADQGVHEYLSSYDSPYERLRELHERSHRPTPPGAGAARRAHPEVSPSPLPTPRL